MKKLWKNFCLCLMLMVFALGFFACGKDKDPVSVDLDGDGTVSAWETLYEGNLKSTRQISNKTIINGKEYTLEVKEIASLSDLKKINEDTVDENTQGAKLYKLVNNIDCNGESICINLRNSILYGNYKVISNFKYGNIADVAEEDEIPTKSNNYALFYQGSAIYDLRLFVGYQSYNLTDTNSDTYISTFSSPLGDVENIEIKGAINVDRKKVDGLVSGNGVQLSLGFNAPYLKPDEEISGFNLYNIKVTGKIDFKEPDNIGSPLTSIGGIASSLNKLSNLMYGNANVDINFSNCIDAYVGQAVGRNEGFITSVNTSGNITGDSHIGESVSVGGVVGAQTKLAEIKNCTSTAKINVSDSKYQEVSSMSNLPYLTVGGICGNSFYGIIDYCTFDGDINLQNIRNNVETGGICGEGDSAIFSNLLSRGAINCTNIRTLFVADTVGRAFRGLMESILSTTKINVDNTADNCDAVYLGMVTVFEDVNDIAVAQFYYSPVFRNIIVGNVSNVDMLPKGSNSQNSFYCNLGLRDKFEYVSTSATEDSPAEILILYPTLFDKQDSYLKYLNTTKVIKTELVAGEKKEVDISDMLTTSSCVQATSSAYTVNNLVKYLKFKYGLNHNEVDLTGIDPNLKAESYKTIKFILNSTKATTRYFEEKSYNGEFEYFDKVFTGACEISIENEMFSFLYHLINSNSAYVYTPIVIDKQFAEKVVVDIPEELPEDSTGEEEMPEEDSSEELPDSGNTEGSDTITSTSDLLINGLAENIKALLNLMADMKVSYAFLNISQVDIESIDSEMAEADTDIRYIEFNARNTSKNFRILIDIKDINDIYMSSIDEVGDMGILLNVYMGV